MIRRFGRVIVHGQSVTKMMMHAGRRGVHQSLGTALGYSVTRQPDGTVIVTGLDRAVAECVALDLAKLDSRNGPERRAHELRAIVAQYLGPFAIDVEDRCL